jgi:hypothetical protein
VWQIRPLKLSHPLLFSVGGRKDEKLRHLDRCGELEPVRRRRGETMPNA